MAFNFSDEDKQEKELTERLPFGITPVKLRLAETGQTEAGKEYMAVTVVAKDGTEETIRAWFVGGAAPISFTTLKGILVHNQSTDALKEKARQEADAVQDSEQLAKLLNDHAMAGDLWVTKYYDPKNTYTNSAGETKRSINTSLVHYEPKLKPGLMPDAMPEATTGGQPANKEATNNIPGDWS